MQFAEMVGAIGHAAGSQRRPVAAIMLACLLGFTGAAGATPKARPSENVATPQGPLLLVVSIGSQRLAVYDRNGRVLESPISSGQSGFETPRGVFAIIERNREHYSNLYDDAPMPNMQRITWSGVAMHAGQLPGYPASHGCIRLPLGVSERLFEMTKLGTRVIVTDHDVVPAPIEHPKLFSPRPGEPTVRTAAAGPPTRIDPRMSPPMRLGAATVAPAQASALPPLTDPFADRPEGTSRAAWAGELTTRAQRADAMAKVAKANAAVAAKAAARELSQVLAAERSRSAQAARVDALEARLAGALKPRAAARAAQEKDAALARLANLLVEVDRLRAAAEAKHGEAERLAAQAAAAEEARNAAGALARDATRSLKPVSVFISRTAGRLYVRQGFQPLFDVPVAIADPQEPIGTHVFTALDMTPGSQAMAWSAVTTVGAMPQVEEVPTRRGRKGLPAALPSVPHLTASAALERIDIPGDVRERVSQMLLPGSSLIISDEDVSPETGKGTDFVVLTR